MKVSWDWLSDFVDLSGVSPEEVADGLTIAGLEVDGVRRTGEGVSGLVVAHTTGIRPHPNADKLRLVTVDTGSTEVEVVCGAPNVDAGQTIVFAPVGARLPGIKKLKPAKIRGIRSEGMICSEAELEVPETVDGIWVLSKDTPLGADAKVALGLEDTVLVLDLTPNRPDALSIHGVAREVAARLGRSLRPRPEGAPWPGNPSPFPVDVEDVRACPRYTAQVLDGATIGPAPWKIRRRLHAVGIRPISNVVDVTNYVNMEWGQPLHAFDLDKVSGERIVVRRARPGERLVTLDGEDRALHAEDLVIADADRPVALAGVMGGRDTEVDGSTRRLLLESACFEPGVVRAGARRHGLHTESSHRFERGVDPTMTADASGYAARLFTETAGATLTGASHDVNSGPAKSSAIEVDCGRVNRLLGADLSASEMIEHLRSIDIPAEGDADALIVHAPPRRPDLRREVDIAEEVARLHGYDHIEAVLPSAVLHGGHRPRTLPLPEGLPPILGRALRDEDDRRKLARIRAALSGARFFEHLALPLRPALPGASQVQLRNPLGELTGLRTSLIDGLLDALHENARHGVEDVRLYEIGRVFTPQEGALPTEEVRLGLAVMGRTPAHWNSEPRAFDFYDVRGVVEGILSALGVDGRTLRTLPHPSPDSQLHPAATAEVRFGPEGPVAGVMGELHPDVRRSRNLPHRTFVAELVVGSIPQKDRLAKNYGGLSRFPSTERDVALLVPEATPASDVLDALQEVRGSRGGRLVEDARIFDVYRGAGIAEGSKSVAVRIQYQAADRTLREDEVVKAHGKIVDALRERLDADIRDF